MRIDEKEFIDFIEKNPKAKYREIAEHFNCSHQWAHTIALKLGLRKKTKPRINIPDSKIKALAEANPRLTYQELADRLGGTRRFIRKRMKKMKIEHFPERQKRVDYEALKDYVLKHKDAKIGDIADLFGFCDCTISSALIKLGLHKKQKKIIDDKKFAKVMTEKPNATIKELAEIFGCSNAAISKAKYRIRNPKEKKPAKEPKIVAWEEYEKILKENPQIPKIELAKRLGVGPSTVGRMLRKNGALRGHIQKVDKTKMMEMLEQGEPVPEIARHFGVTDSAIRGALARLGLKIKEIRATAQNV